MTSRAGSSAFVFMRVDEFLAQPDPDAGRTRWGDWEYRPETNVLTLVVEMGNGRTRDEFEVDLDRCTTPEQTLGWIFWVSATEPQAVADLVEALACCTEWWQRECAMCP